MSVKINIAYVMNINLYDSRSLSRFDKKLAIELDEDIIETHVREDESREENYRFQSINV